MVAQADRASNEDKMIRLSEELIIEAANDLADTSTNLGLIYPKNGRNQLYWMRGENS